MPFFQVRIRSAWGNYLIRVEHSEYSELDRLADSFNIMASTLDRVVRDLSDSKNEVLKVNEYLKDQYSLTKARERELQLVMENSYDGIVLLNPDFAIIRISSAALKLFHQPVKRIDIRVNLFQESLIIRYGMKFWSSLKVQLTAEP